MLVLSKLECDYETVVDYSSQNASSARLVDGFGEAHAYMLRFAAGGMIGRHEAGFGQLLIVWPVPVGCRVATEPAPRWMPVTSCTSNVESSTPKAATLV